MKKDNDRAEDNDMRAEYDPSELKGGVRGKYLDRYSKGTNLVPTRTILRTAFPTDEAVNQALRSLVRGSSAGR